MAIVPPTPEGIPSYGAVILAAGRSSRLGRPKQLVPIGGQPLVVRATRAALDAGARPVAVVVGAHAGPVCAVLEPLPVLVVDHAGWAEGMASSLRVGLNSLLAAEPTLEAVLIAPCDQPALDAALVQRLLAAQRRTGLGMAAARYAGGLGAPALFRREHFEALAGLSGDRGARALLNADPRNVAAVEAPELAADLDTPADLEARTGGTDPPA